MSEAENSLKQIPGNRPLRQIGKTEFVESVNTPAIAEIKSVEDVNTPTIAEIQRDSAGHPQEIVR